MEYYVSSHWRYVMAVLQFFFGASLMLTCLADRCSTLRGAVRSAEPYFYSFSPVLLLIYILYKISTLH
jgi:hypothetical protein